MIKNETDHRIEIVFLYDSCTIIRRDKRHDVHLKFGNYKLQVVTYMRLVFLVQYETRTMSY